jgi:hypothetical protein
VTPHLVSAKELVKSRIAMAQKRIEQAAVRRLYSAVHKKAQGLQRSITAQEQRIEILRRAVGKSAHCFGAGRNFCMVAPQEMCRAFAFSSACYMIRERCLKSLTGFQAEMEQTRAECGRTEKDLAAISDRLDLLQERSRRINMLRLAVANSLECAENEDKFGLRACQCGQRN